MLLATRQKHQFRSLHINLKDSHTEQVHEHRHLGVILMMNLAGDRTLVKVFQKIFICCHSSDALWTLLSASCFTMLIFPLT